MDITEEGPVDEPIAVIKESIKEAGVSTTSGTRGIEVTSVRLILKVVASISLGVEGELSHEVTHQLQLGLGPA